MGFILLYTITMSFLELQLDTEIDFETVELANEQISYFSYIPKHIRYSAVNLTAVSNKEPLSSIHMLQNFVSVKSGTLNIPVLN